MLYGYEFSFGCIYILYTSTWFRSNGQIPICHFQSIQLSLSLFIFTLCDNTQFKIPNETRDSLKNIIMCFSWLHYGHGHIVDLRWLERSIHWTDKRSDSIFEFAHHIWYYSICCWNIFWIELMCSYNYYNSWACLCRS